MSIRGNTRYCFVSSFTSLGFRTFIPDLVDGIKKVFILKGAPGTGKSTLSVWLARLSPNRGMT